MKKRFGICLVLCLALALAACGGQAPSSDVPAATEAVSTIAPTEEAVETTPAETVPAVTEPEFYTGEDMSYALCLGEPVLGEAAAELVKAGDVAAAAEQITNVGDAIWYMAAVSRFHSPEDACRLLADLLKDDYDEVGLIELSRPDNYYYLAYVQQDGVLYPFNPFHMDPREPRWPTALQFGTDAEALCKDLMVTFPYNRDNEPMTSYTLIPVVE